MQRTRVSSSNLASVGYDPVSATLEVQFHSGEAWQYFGVPADLFSRPMRAFSKGSFFSAHIRGRFQDRRVL